MNKSTLARMLSTIPDELMSHDQLGQLAFSLSHFRDETTWFIAEDIMTVVVGDVVKNYDLYQFTIGQLISVLAADGFIIRDVDPALTKYSAVTLGEITKGANGTGAYKENSLLIGMLKTYARQLRYLRDSVPAMLRQMVIQTSSGEWLNKWGKRYNIDRMAGMTDKQYADYIPKEVFRQRVNALAIEQAVKDITGYDIMINEPWQNVFTLDVSKLSGSDRLQDGKEIGFCIIKPTSFSNVPWDIIMPIIMRNKAGGVLVLDPTIMSKIGAISVFRGEADLGILSRMVIQNRVYRRENVLDEMRLSVNSSHLVAYSNYYQILPLKPAYAGIVEDPGYMQRDITISKNEIIGSVTDWAVLERHYMSDRYYLQWSTPEQMWDEHHWVDRTISTFFEPEIIFSGGDSSGISHVKTDFNSVSSVLQREARLNLITRMAAVAMSSYGATYIAKHETESEFFLKAVKSLSADAVLMGAEFTYNNFQSVGDKLVIDYLLKAAGDSRYASEYDAQMKVFATRFLSLDENGKPIITWGNSGRRWDDRPWSDQSIPPFNLN